MEEVKEKKNLKAIQFLKELKRHIVDESISKIY